MNRSLTRPSRRRHHRIAGAGGIALLEVLIVATLLAIALLGLASMQTSSMRFTQSAYNHTQAALLAQELLERMRSNRASALAGLYEYDLKGGPTSLPAAPACKGELCDGESVARQDIRRWGEKLFDALPGAQATTQYDDEHARYDIVIRWTEQGASAPEETCLQAAANDTACLRLDARP